MLFFRNKPTVLQQGAATVAPEGALRRGVSGTSRRGFFGLVAGAVGASVAPRRPPSPCAGLSGLRANLALSNWCPLKVGDIVSIDSVFDVNALNRKIGDTIIVKRPARFYIIGTAQADAAPPRA